MPVKRVLVFGLMLLLVMRGAKAQKPSSTNAPLVFGEAVAGSLEGGEQAAWTFEGEAGQMIVLSAERFPPNPASELDPLLELYDSAGNLLASDDNSSVWTDAILGFALPKTDTYTVIVKNLTDWAGGSYLLTLANDPFPPECQTPMGTMIEGDMSSAINSYAVHYRVFLPPCHELMGRRYPYVLLMHGSNSGDGLWDTLGADEAIVRGMALQRLPPMALVLPFGGELANTNTFREGASWEYVIVDELVPYMEKTYCLATDRHGRAIGGISRGGFWAFLIAFRHPELFSALGGHSPFFDLYNAPPTHNPLDLAQGTPPQPSLRIWMDRGKDDYAQLNIDRQHDNLTSAGIEHTFQLYPVGQHANDYWSAHVEDYLRFYSAEWTSDYTVLPPCELEGGASP